MNQAHDDERLKAGFRALRDETRREVPDFAAMMAEAGAAADARPELTVSSGDTRRSRPATRRRAWAVGGWATVATAAAIAGVLLARGANDADREFESMVALYTSQLSPAAAQSPTASLLDVPGMSLTRTVPSLVEPLRGLDPSTRPTPPEGRDS